MGEHQNDLSSIILFLIISLVASGARCVEFLIWETVQHYCFVSTILINTIFATKYMQMLDMSS